MHYINKAKGVIEDGDSLSYICMLESLCYNYNNEICLTCILYVDSDIKLCRFEYMGRIIRGVK